MKMNSNLRFSYTTPKHTNRATIALAGTSSIAANNNLIGNETSTTPIHYPPQDNIGSSTNQSFQTKFQQDLNLINNKILDVQCDMSYTKSSPVITPLISPVDASIHSGPNFVTNLRSLISDNTDSNDKLYQYQCLQKIIDKMTELDRLILRKTSTISNASTPQTIEPRRKLGCDLNLFPTHMILIDRILDLYTQVRRPQVDHSGITITYTPSKQSYKSPSPINSSQQPPIHAQALTILGESIDTSSKESNSLQDKYEKVIKLFEESENKRKLLETENLKLRKKISSLQGDLSSMKEKMNQSKESHHETGKDQSNVNSLILQLTNERSKHEEIISNIVKILRAKCDLMQTNSSNFITDYEDKANNLVSSIVCFAICYHVGAANSRIF